MKILSLEEIEALEKALHPDSANYREYFRAFRTAREYHRLREALGGLLSKIDDGSLVRNIDRDHEPDWAMRALRLVQAIQVAQEALKEGDK